MKCYVCGCRLSEKDFCTSCGADVRIYKRIIYASNRCYNDGLEKASVRDLSGAIISLRQSLKFNKKNTQARNLLGLVYFEMGEAVSALSEWVISKNLQGDKNIADDYIKEIQTNPQRLDTINQTIKKYNQALTYCYQGSNDLAIIQLKKVLAINPKLICGYQLLALLYIYAEDWDKARRTLIRATQIDTNNTTTLRYLKDINKTIREREERTSGRKRKTQEDIYSYQSGNDTIIQPMYAKEKIGFSSVINIIIGIVIGVAIAWFLILPARIGIATDENDANFKAVSEELTAEKASKLELEEQIKTLQTQNDEQSAQIEELTGKAGMTQATDFLEAAAKAYIDNPDDVMTIMDQLEQIDANYLETASDSFKTLYEQISSQVKTEAAAQYFEKGRDAFDNKDYETAITELTKAWELDQTNGSALYNLAHAYRNTSNAEKADELYQQVIILFPDTEIAEKSRGFISSEVDVEE
ncbi:MAG: tetratricopeptide repeat protein [Clostridia bacterium]|nr:tetratricopeptide repeat protein [Clostridia bacterium]